MNGEGRSSELRSPQRPSPNPSPIGHALPSKRLPKSEGEGSLTRVRRWQRSDGCGRKDCDKYKSLRPPNTCIFPCGRKVLHHSRSLRPPSTFDLLLGRKDYDKHKSLRPSELIFVYSGQLSQPQVMYMIPMSHTTLSPMTHVSDSK